MQMQAAKCAPTDPEHPAPTAGFGSSTAMAVPPVAALCAAKWRAAARRRSSRGSDGGCNEEEPQQQQGGELTGLAALLGPAVARVLQAAREHDVTVQRAHEDGSPQPGAALWERGGAGEEQHRGMGDAGCCSKAGGTSAGGAVSQPHVPALLLPGSAAHSGGGSAACPGVPTARSTAMHAPFSARSQLPPPPPAADTAAKRLLTQLGGGAAASTRLLQEMAARADPGPALYRLATAVMAHASGGARKQGGSSGGGASAGIPSRHIAKLVERQVVQQGGVRAWHVGGRRVGQVGRPQAHGTIGDVAGGPTANASSAASELGRQLGVKVAKGGNQHQHQHGPSGMGWGDGGSLASARTTQAGNAAMCGTVDGDDACSVRTATVVTTCGLVSDWGGATTAASLGGPGTGTIYSTVGSTGLDADARRWQRASGAGAGGGQGGGGAGGGVSGGGASHTNSVLSGYVLTSGVWAVATDCSDALV